jgi:type II secretory pathway pseudopilin PulG
MKRIIFSALLAIAAITTNAQTVNQEIKLTEQSAQSIAAAVAEVSQAQLALETTQAKLQARIFEAFARARVSPDDYELTRDATGALVLRAKKK